MASAKGSETRTLTEFTGVYIREVTDPRKLNQGRKKDFAFDITYKVKVDGVWKQKWEAVGWKSEGVTAEKAFKARAVLLDRIAKGELTPSQERAKAEIEAVTIGKFFEETVMKHQKANNKTWNRAEARFNTHLRPRFGALTFKEVTPAMLCNWRDEMLTREKDRLSEASVSIMMNILHQCFRLAKDLGTIRHNLFEDTTVSKGRTVPLVKIPNPQNNNRERALTREEADLLIRSAIERAEEHYRVSWGNDPDMADIIIVTLKHGLRAQEVCGLQWKDIVFQGNFIMLWDQKNGKKMPFRMAPSVTALMERRYGEGKEPETLVFPGTRTGGRRSDLSVPFKKIVDKAKLNQGREDDPYQRVTPHTLRHTFGTWLAQDGVDIKTLQKLMRHADIKDTLRYMNFAPDYTDQIIDRLDASFCAPCASELDLPPNVLAMPLKR